MSRKTNVINYIITMAVTLITLFVVIYISNLNYKQNTIDAMLMLLCGAIITGLINTFAHEFGHYFAGKRNGFAFSEMVVWFFRWKKGKKKVRFNFVMIGEEAGYTEMIPQSPECVEKGLKKMTLGGVVASFVVMMLGVPALFLTVLPVWIYSIWAMFLPVGAYFFFGCALPATNSGVRNDGAVLYGIKKQDDETKVTINLLKIQAELFQGKRPCEVNQELFFDLPQLPEDCLTFAMLLNARYNYYLDKEDFAKAKQTIDRLLSIEEYLPKIYVNMLKTEALYASCTFDYNAELADDYVYELEKYLNNVNNCSTVRAKLAYLLYVQGEKESAEIFIKKGLKEADRCNLKGIGLMETKLFNKMKLDSEI